MIKIKGTEFPISIPMVKERPDGLVVFAAAHSYGYRVNTILDPEKGVAIQNEWEFDRSNDWWRKYTSKQPKEIHSNFLHHSPKGDEVQYMARQYVQAFTYHVNDARAREYVTIWNVWREKYGKLFDLNVKAKSLARTIKRRVRSNGYQIKYLQDQYEHLHDSSQILIRDYGLDQDPVPPFPADVLAEMAIMKALEEN